MKVSGTKLRLLAYFMFFLSLAGFWGCEDNPSSPETPVSYNFGNGLIVLNEGGWGQNNASVTYKSFTSDSLFQNVFSNANSGGALGDVANHMIINDKKAYIVVNGSDKLEIVGLEDFKITRTVTFRHDAGPRQIAVYNSEAYVSAFSGYVYKVSLSSGAVTDSIAVGSYPESITEASGKLFVANTGYGYDSTVSVIDPSTGKNVKTITVGLNPQYSVKGTDGYLYVVNTGSYSPGSTVVSGVWKIDPQTLSVVDMIELSGNPGKICNYKNNTLLVTNSEGAYLIDPSAKTKKLAIRLADVNPNAGPYSMIYALTYDSVNDEIYCGNTKDNKQKGEIAVFKEESGSFVKKSAFDCGVNPNWVVPVR
jgi:YVTN family beta-propeller protein